VQTAAEREENDAIARKTLARVRADLQRIAELATNALVGDAELDFVTYEVRKRAKSIEADTRDLGWYLKRGVYLEQQRAR
jgi:hypothetical protein